MEGFEPTFHPNCFLLSWNDETGYSASWTFIKDVPETQRKWGKSVEWKELGTTIYVVSSETTEGHSPPEFSYCRIANKGHLKSHLQKCVRRGRKGLAMKTLYHFLALDRNEALRRLAIIAVEDALPLKGFSVLMWLVAAVSKDYPLTQRHLGFLLGYVFKLAACEYYEQFDFTLPEQTRSDTVKRMKLSRLPAGDGKDLCYSLGFRKAYGGMKGDMVMLQSALIQWKARYATRSRFLSLLGNDEPMTFITSPSVALDPVEFLVVAIDFHCEPNLMNDIWMRHDELSYEEIKAAIWHCSSCLTNKKLLGENHGQRQWTNGDYKATWDTIKGTFMWLARSKFERALLQ